jgi:hypothetical protein
LEKTRKIYGDGTRNRKNIIRKKSERQKKKGKIKTWKRKMKQSSRK